MRIVFCNFLRPADILIYLSPTDTDISINDSGNLHSFSESVVFFQIDSRIHAKSVPCRILIRIIVFIHEILSCNTHSIDLPVNGHVFWNKRLFRCAPGCIQNRCCHGCFQFYRIFIIRCIYPVADVLTHLMNLFSAFFNPFKTFLPVFFADWLVVDTDIEDVVSGISRIILSNQKHC